MLFFFLPSYPEHVGWLSEKEKEIQVRRMGIHSSARSVSPNTQHSPPAVTDLYLP